MNTYTTSQVIDNCLKSGLISRVSKLYGDKIYLTMTAKANDAYDDRRNQVYLTVSDGRIHLRKLQNGYYNATYKIFDEANVSNGVV